MVTAKAFANYANVSDNCAKNQDWVRIFCTEAKRFSRVAIVKNAKLIFRQGQDQRN